MAKATGNANDTSSTFNATTAQHQPSASHSMGPAHVALLILFASVSFLSLSSCINVDRKVSPSTIAGGHWLVDFLPDACTALAKPVPIAAHSSFCSRFQ